jgi:hypothetical protein
MKQMGEIYTSPSKRQILHKLRDILCFGCSTKLYIADFL